MNTSLKVCLAGTTRAIPHYTTSHRELCSEEASATHAMSRGTSNLLTKPPAVAAPCCLRTQSFVVNASSSALLARTNLPGAAPPSCSCNSQPVQTPLLPCCKDHITAPVPAAVKEAAGLHRHCCSACVAVHCGYSSGRTASASCAAAHITSCWVPVTCSPAPPPAGPAQGQHLWPPTPEGRT